MKTVAEIEANRKQYHSNTSLNAVNRSSLLVHEIEKNEVVISFLNHFLLKRKIPEVALKITAIDLAGKKIKSLSFMISEPKVYNINLTELFNKQASSYEIEFFSAQNLFIPFPAVMINHIHKDNISQVHSYNRVLNDVYENDSINNVSPHEAGLDYINTSDQETFFCFMAGSFDIEDKLECELNLNDKTYSKTISLNLKRYQNRIFKVSEIFTNIKDDLGHGFLKIKQPKQTLFYGRMLWGQINKNGAFSADHTFYDCSNFEEYWQNANSAYMVYPYIKGITKLFRVFPIMSPGTYEFQINFTNHIKGLLFESDKFCYSSPNNKILDIDLEEFIKNSKINENDIDAIVFTAKTLSNRLPSRISCQLIQNFNNSLTCSFGKQLLSQDSFKTSFTRKLRWGQAIVGEGYKTIISITLENENLPDGEFEFELYDSNGLIMNRHFKCKELSGINIDIDKLLIENHYPINNSSADFIWYQAKSNTHALQGFTLTQSPSNHCSGDHSF
jgi:hypothetical protein